MEGFRGFDGTCQRATAAGMGQDEPRMLQLLGLRLGDQQLPFCIAHSSRKRDEGHGILLKLKLCCWGMAARGKLAEWPEETGLAYWLHLGCWAENATRKSPSGQQFQIRLAPSHACGPYAVS